MSDGFLTTWGLDDLEHQTPGTEIILANVPWDMDSNVIDWSRNNLRTYLLSLEDSKRIFVDMFLTVGDTWRVDLPQHQAENFNYCYFRFINAPKEHPGYVRSEYGHFIIAHRKINPSVTELGLNLDIWSTYFNDINIRYGIYRRGHYPVEKSASISTYLSDPINNCDYILDDDVTYSQNSRLHSHTFQQVGNDTKFIVIATPLSADDWQNIGRITPESKEDYENPSYSDWIEYRREQDWFDFDIVPVSNNDGSRYFDQDPTVGDSWDLAYNNGTVSNNPDGGIARFLTSTSIPENHRWGYQYNRAGFQDWFPDYEQAEIRFSPFYASERIPTSLHYYAIPATQAESFFQLHYDYYPHFFKCLEYLYVLDENMFTVKTMHSIFGYTIRELEQFKQSTISIDLSKLQDSSLTYTKFYTYPYMQLEFSDGSRTLPLKIEQLHDPKIILSVQNATPWLQVSAFIDGYASDTHTSLNWERLDGTTHVQSLTDGNWFQYMLGWDIPVYAVWIDGKLNNRLMQWWNVKSQINQANALYSTQVRQANTNYENQMETWRNSSLQQKYQILNQYLVHKKQAETDRIDTNEQISVEADIASNQATVQLSNANRLISAEYSNSYADANNTKANASLKSTLLYDEATQTKSKMDYENQYYKDVNNEQTSYSNAVMNNQVLADNFFINSSLELENDYAALQGALKGGTAINTSLGQLGTKVGAISAVASLGLIGANTWAGIITNEKMADATVDNNNQIYNDMLFENNGICTSMNNLHDTLNSDLKLIVDIVQIYNSDYVNDVGSNNQTTMKANADRTQSAKSLNATDEKSLADTIWTANRNYTTNIMNRDNLRTIELFEREKYFQILLLQNSQGNDNYVTYRMDGTEGNAFSLEYVTGGEYRNMLESRETAVLNAKEQYQNMLQQAYNSWNAGKLQNPTSISTYGGSPDNDILETRGITIKKRTMQTSDLVKIAGIWRRYGYMWEGTIGKITDWSINTKDDFTYWQFYEITLERTKLNQYIKQAITSLFLNGITIWKTPKAIEEVVY